MQTQAQKLFDSNYKVIRQLWIMCGCKDKAEMKRTLKHMEEDTLEAIDKEITSDLVRKQLSRQSTYEKDELKDFHEPQGYDEDEE